MDPGDLHLPAVLDSLLTYIADTLPPSLYNFIINFLSHCLALLSTLLNLVVALLSRSPAEWNAQVVLPPLISLLAAYLALVSIYRTTSWLIRTSLWFAKWGILFGALTASIGWYMGTTQAGGIVTSGLVPHIVDLLLGIINGQNHDSVDSRREGRIADSGSHSRSPQRPKAWESFDRHREWQYNADHDDETEQKSDLETLFNSLMDAAGRIRESGPWWSGLKNVMDSTDSHSANERSQMRDRRNSVSRSR